MFHSLSSFEWWQVTVFVIGILAVIGTVMALFLSSDRLTGDLSSENLPPVDSPEFISTIAHIADTEIQIGGETRMLQNGDAFLKSLTEDIASAKDSVTITNYIWKDGDMSDAIFAAILERSRSGVRVLILLDDMGGSDAPKEKLEEIRKNGGDFAYFRKPRIGSLTRFTKRTHRRAIVIDGKIGYVGGIAIQDSWLGNADKPDVWRDNMLRVTGPLVPHIQNAFGQIWTATTGEILDSRFYPPNPQQTSGIKAVSVLSSPAADTQPLPLVFWYSFASAKKSIYITNPYFLPLPTQMKALEDAAKRGVDVRVLVPSHLTDAKQVRLASQSNYAPLLEAGAKIYEYQRSRIHAKNFVIDSDWFVTGSANLDVRSAILNEENIVGIQDAAFGKEMEEVFLNDLKDAKEITKTEWDKRSYAFRTLQQLSKIFQKQY